MSKIGAVPNPLSVPVPLVPKNMIKRRRGEEETVVSIDGKLLSSSLIKNSTESVKIRIALVMDEYGNWSASGWNPKEGGEGPEAMLDIAHDGDFVDPDGYTNRVLFPFWVEVMVPIPQPRVLEGASIIPARRPTE